MQDRTLPGPVHPCHSCRQPFPCEACGRTGSGSTGLSDWWQEQATGSQRASPSARGQGSQRLCDSTPGAAVASTSCGQGTWASKGTDLGGRGRTGVTATIVGMLRTLDVAWGLRP